MTKQLDSLEVEEYTVPFRGRTLTLRQMSLRDYMRLGKVCEAAMKHIPITAEEVTEELTFQQAFKLTMKVLDAAFGDMELDLTNPDDMGVPGKFATIVFTEIMRITGLKLNEILDGGQEAFINVVTEIWRHEAARPFAQIIFRSMQPVTSLLLMTFDLWRDQILNLVASHGGPKSGGGPL